MGKKKSKKSVSSDGSKVTGQAEQADQDSNNTNDDDDDEQATTVPTPVPVPSPVPIEQPSTPQTEDVIVKVDDVKTDDTVVKLDDVNVNDDDSKVEEVKIEEIVSKVEEIKIEDVKVLEEVKPTETTIETATVVDEVNDEKTDETGVVDKNSLSPSRIVDKAQPYVQWAQTTCSTTVEVGIDLGKKLASQSVEYSKGITKATHESLVKASEFTNASIVKANDAIIKQKQRILRERKIIKNADIRYKKLVRFNGSIEVQVEAGAVIKVPYFVPKGRCIMWKIKVKSMQLGFGLNVRTQEIGGAVETEVESLVNIDFKDPVLVGHRKAADIDRHLVFVFDNTVNKLLAKTCVYRIIQGDKAEEEWKEYSALIEKKEVEKQQRGEDVEDVISDEEDDIVEEKVQEPVKTDAVENKESGSSEVTPKTSWFTNMYATAQSATASLSQKAQVAAKDAVAHPRVVGAMDYLKSTSLYKKYMTPSTSTSEQPAEKSETDSTPSTAPILPSSSTESNTTTDNDGEEDKFIQTVKPAAATSSTPTEQSSLLLKENTSIKMVQGATIDPDSFSSMWSDLELPDSVTIKLIVLPLEECKYGFPIVSLAAHLQNVGMYEVARGILPTGGGVKIFSYCEGYPPENASEYPVMFLLESICTKQVNESNEDLWELVITMKCTDTGYLFDFMKFIQLKSLLSEITFTDPVQRLAYNEFLVNY